MKTMIIAFAVALAWPADAQDTLQLKLRAPVAGDRSVATTSSDLGLDIEYVIGGEVKGKDRQIQRELHEKTVTVVEAKDGAVKKIKVKITQSNRISQTGRGKNETKSPAVGNTYQVTHEGDEFVVKTEKGEDVPPEVAQEVLRRCGVKPSSKKLYDPSRGIPDLMPKGGFVKDKAIDVAPEIARRMLSGGNPNSVLSGIKLTYRGPEVRDAIKCAKFEVTMDVGNTEDKVDFKFKGTIFSALDTAYIIAMEYEGPVNVTRVVKNGDQEVTVKGKGKSRGEGLATYFIVE